jgi:ribonuclease HII
VQALAAVTGPPAMILVDGNRAPALGWPCRAVVKGDATVASIAAASIAAKVARDAHMAALAADFPAYGWERNKGYGVAAHAEALRLHGVSVHHRRSFAPIRKLLAV